MPVSLMPEVGDGTLFTFAAVASSLPEFVGAVMSEFCLMDNSSAQIGWDSVRQSILSLL